MNPGTTCSGGNFVLVKMFEWGGRPNDTRDRWMGMLKLQMMDLINLPTVKCEKGVAPDSGVTQPGRSRGPNSSLRNDVIIDCVSLGPFVSIVVNRETSDSRAVTIVSFPLSLLLYEGVCYEKREVIADNLLQSGSTRMETFLEISGHKFSERICSCFAERHHVTYWNSEK
ncbi:hypothetical protein CDAR_31661 [Caerostris darwini]|uniref:Uncharacterized protein n=1 Tax=Caerostris darwini TaxID=1538125 RepID=A0AAV4NTN9_9ARAC|nr:hypothetical protein CDAR_31661 [Caerostris darwini]